MSVRLVLPNKYRYETLTPPYNQHTYLFLHFYDPEACTQLYQLYSLENDGYNVHIMGLINNIPVRFVVRQPYTIKKQLVPKEMFPFGDYIPISGLLMGILGRQAGRCVRVTGNCSQTTYIL